MNKPPLEIRRLPNGSVLALGVTDEFPKELPQQFHIGETVNIVRSGNILQGTITQAVRSIVEYADGIKATHWMWHYHIAYNGTEFLMGVSEEDLLYNNPRTSGALLSLLQATTAEQQTIVAKYAAMETALAQVKRQMGLLLDHQDAIYDPESVWAELEKWVGIMGAALHLGMTPHDVAAAAD